MKEKYIFVLIVVCSMVVSVSANPQILTYNSNNWYNDRYQVVDTSVVTEYNVISSEPFVIEVVQPKLQYQSMVFNEGETITIQKGSTTITLTADTPTVLTIE